MDSAVHDKNDGPNMKWYKFCKYYEADFPLQKLWKKIMSDLKCEYFIASPLYYGLFTPSFLHNFHLYTWVKTEKRILYKVIYEVFESGMLS
jgi:hypothetical protein